MSSTSILIVSDGGVSTAGAASRRRRVFVLYRLFIIALMAFSDSNYGLTNIQQPGGVGICQAEETLPPILEGKSMDDEELPSKGTIIVGGERPAEVYIPAAYYNASSPSPLLLILHGYSDVPENGLNFFGPAAESEGFVYVAPSGTAEEGTGKLFWNAPHLCCDINGTNVDDLGYLMGLIEEISARLNIDRKRVYIIGLSNGSFMAHAMACTYSDRIAAIVGFAGGTYADRGLCNATSPLSVLYVHGTADDVVSYTGGESYRGTYAGAVDTVKSWATLNRCHDADTPVYKSPIIFEPGKGNATTPVTFLECPEGIDVMLYSVGGGGHILDVPPAFTIEIADFLVHHKKQDC